MRSIPFGNPPQQLTSVLFYYWHCSHSMRRLSVLPSVCLSHLSTAAAACGGFAAVIPTGRRCLLIAARPASTATALQQHDAQQHGGHAAANASSATFTADVECWTQTCLWQRRTTVLGLTMRKKRLVTGLPRIIWENSHGVSQLSTQYYWVSDAVDWS